jgi:hypothetical protein
MIYVSADAPASVETADLSIGGAVMSTDAATPTDLFALTAASNPATFSCSETTGMSSRYGSFACLVHTAEPLTPVGFQGGGAPGGSPAGAIPEPGTIALLGTGLLMLWGVSRIIVTGRLRR